MLLTLQGLINLLNIDQEQIQTVNQQSFMMNDDKLLELTINGVSTDTRTAEKNQLFVPLIGEKFNGHDYRQVAYNRGCIVTFWDQSIVVPQISGIYILVNDTLQALQNFAHQYRKSLDIQVIGITGSNGKTTTKDLVASVLRQKYQVFQTKGNLNNHIGVPLTLLSLTSQDEIAVVEMGMSGFGEIALLSKIASPDIGIVTNIGESHIENLGSRKNIGKAKFELLENMQAGIALVNGDDAIIEELIAEFPAEHPIQFIRYAVNNENAQYCAKIVNSQSHLIGAETIFDVIQNNNEKFATITTREPGQHNIYNSLVAFVTGLLMGVSIDKIQKGLMEANRTPMRMDISRYQNSYIINDAYNSSPTSTKAALTYIAQLSEPLKKVVLLGDMLELGEYAKQFHKDIGEYTNSLPIDVVLCYGNDAKYFSSVINGAEYYPNGTEDSLIERVKTELSNGCILLLKGSRGMKLERFIAFTKEVLSENGEG
ncbi:hypothetical protein BHU72_07680 [Desulfuribacillus stibiiarsenatis]|uniref:UDP-N-acetylmuramoyl-tripeptide--D-alanyl-D-alanine ligase n=1 Tax=Desulfuribacillus stibiiarsenatis TaxID=1390249 RepID=A0A1E5L3I9_9FIRM|nr:UDP-N-acetylmuramoyl-tripeptide--D-alanyl-D-alanine ligase [Desulfuribacillus stibiiarsenatis]OEH84708.1 hypothetical protein BHU72_07680 [Desulfuribacillus stibiiarsenatis]